MVLPISQISLPLKVPNISELESVYSSDVVLLSIPWNINICKQYSVDEQWLSVYLVCTEENQIPEWTCPAYLSVKLKSFNEDDISIEHQCDPFVFEQYSVFGVGNLIEWRDLFDPTEGYVKNDEIELEIKIEAAEQKCTMTFDAMAKCCENSLLAKYQLTVTNVDKLMAVRSLEFKLKNSPWTLTVYKSSSAYLALRLESMLKMDDCAKICNRTVFSVPCKWCVFIDTIFCERLEILYGDVITYVRYTKDCMIKKKCL